MHIHFKFIELPKNANNSNNSNQINSKLINFQLQLVGEKNVRKNHFDWLVLLLFLPILTIIAYNWQNVYGIMTEFVYGVLLLLLLLLVLNKFLLLLLLHNKHGR